MYGINYQRNDAQCKLKNYDSLIHKLNINSIIVSCILGLYKTNSNNQIENSIKISLFLVEKETDIEKENNDYGIIIDFGNYWPQMNKEESEKVKEHKVIYRYGDKGGLKYYYIKFSEFLEKYGIICYINMDIKLDNQMTFNYFINTIANILENKWTKENYSFNNNNQTFIIEALKVLKPTFNKRYINFIEPSLKKKKIFDILPKNIQEILENLKN